MSSCKSCINQSSIVETQSEITQKRIQNQVRVPSSMYIMNFSSLHNTINNNNEGIKHDSYQRRLNKLKQKNNEKRFINNLKNSNIPLIGNKASDYEIVSSNRNADNYLNCGFDFYKYLQSQGTQKAYNNFSQLVNVPTNLTLASGDISYNFGGYINDLSNIEHDSPEISYDTYIDGFSSSTNSVSNAKKLSDITKLTFFIDFQFLENASDGIIFEIGSKGNGSDKGGVSLYYYLNKLYLNIGQGPNPGTNKGFHYVFDDISSNQNRNIIVLEILNLNKNSNTNNLSVKLYYNNNIIKDDIKNFNQNSLLYSRFKLGFGRGGGSFAHHIDLSAVENLKNTQIDIKGQFRIFENSYQELVRSNYFSNL